MTKKNANIGLLRIAPAAPTAVSIAIGMKPMGRTVLNASDSVLAVLAGKNASI